MKKIKALILKNLINKYRGAAAAYIVGASVSATISYLAEGPQWIGGLVSQLLTAVSQGEITEINAATLTLVMTPLVASAVQAAINAYQSAGVEKIQKANGEEVDGWVGKRTIESASKK